MEIEHQVDEGRVSNPRGGARENAGSGGKREGAGRKRNYQERPRNWLTVVYPESLREDWKSVVSSWHVPTLISPLHDKDIEHDGDKTPKKPHYHLIMMFSGHKSYEQVSELVQGLAARGHVEPKPCHNLRGSARYLCHMDDADKAQYNAADVTSIGGADYYGIVDLPTDRERYIKEMCAWCRETGCISYAELLDEAAANHPDWHSCLVRTSTMVMFRYIRSIEDELKKGKYRKPVPESVPVPPQLDEVSPLDVARARVANAENALQEARAYLEAMQRKFGEAGAVGRGDDGGGADV